MDPATAFGLASGVFQLAQVGGQVLLTAREIYKDGMSTENSTLQHQIATFEDSIRALQTKLMKTPRLKTSEEYELEKIVDKCIGTSRELIAKLEELRPTTIRSKRQAFKKGFWAVWEKNNVRKLHDRLEQYRRAIETRILVGLMTRLDVLTIQEDSAFTSLDLTVQNVILDIWASHSKLIHANAAEHEVSRRQVAQHFQQVQNDRVNEARRQKLLDSLFFSDIYARQERVRENHKKTFEWIFDESGYGAPHSSNFTRWLSEKGGIYWINGKAGSGKSTLMNYVCQERKTKDTLKLWSGPCQLVLPKFFFWNAGSLEQKSILGLLRSLAFQILEACPELVPEDFDHVCDSSGPGDRPVSTWTEQRLTALIKHLLGKSGPSIKFCFFIDGLDEFESPIDDSDHLVDMIKALDDFPNVKICVSSRPEHTFELAFQQTPQLRLEDLTRKDMLIYVEDQFRKSVELLEFITTKREAWRWLLKSLLDKAAGVFLWVTLVTRELIRGIKNKDSVEQLIRRLEQTPSDLYSLYESMLKKLDKVYMDDARLQFFWMLEEFGPWQPDVLDLAFVVALSNNQNLDILDVKGCECHGNPAAMSALRQRIHITSAGLLETHFQHNRAYKKRVDDLDYGVDFLHRSVREFLLDTNRGRDLLDFSDARQTCAYQLMSLSTIEQMERSLFWESTIGMLDRTMCYAFCCGDDSNSALRQLMPNVKACVQKLNPTDILREERLSTIIDCYGTKALTLDNYLSVCAAYGLYRYIIEAIESEAECTFSSEGMLVLLRDTIIFFRVHSTRRFFDKPKALLLRRSKVRYQRDFCRLIELLLHRGADPNATSEVLARACEKKLFSDRLILLEIPPIAKCSWHAFLRQMWQTKHSRKSEWDDQSWAAATASFLNHGANLESMVQLYNKDSAPTLAQLRFECGVSFVISRCLDRSILNPTHAAQLKSASQGIQLVEMIWERFTSTAVWPIADVKGAPGATEVTDSWLRIEEDKAARPIERRQKKQLVAELNISLQSLRKNVGLALLTD